MDDRIFSAKIGAPVPDWDLEHRLSTIDWVGPDCQDGATTYRINSTFIEATEQCHMVRHWYAGGIIIAFVMMLAAAFTFCAMVVVSINRGFPLADRVGLLLPLTLVVGLLYCLSRYGKEEFFARTRYPIRFNRKSKRLYALIREEGGRSRALSEDKVEEIEWDERSIFCIHREYDGVYHYWIRYYKLDEFGNVQKAVAIGRDWDGVDGLQELLSQWNYWCWFMNRGPEGLPCPGIFLPEKENVFEAFLCCMYGMAFRLRPALRVVGFPMFATLACFRIISMWTCSPPRWPSDVLDSCLVQAGDPFDEPKSFTPVGWHKTILAIENKTYPELQCVKIDDWKGEPDGRKNAILWAEDKVVRNRKFEGAACK
ncbi:DUF6708 domain-containing protein [Pseudoduganella albidiflava]|uniref:DUF6708 domain-containing protein n=1 Tax=Pseudoduganella albidiflava TaxID=321983 RepID=A0ABX5RYZ1_9BURK|nr:DUF6708 domain-containing protein [Pseudoduganella albidiflava]QBI03252.1 hypothetical protein EYF70_22285 [Pseudoduganella albidiflava]